MSHIRATLRLYKRLSKFMKQVHSGGGGVERVRGGIAARPSRGGVSVCAGVRQREAVRAGGEGTEVPLYVARLRRRPMTRRCSRSRRWWRPGRSTRRPSGRSSRRSYGSCSSPPLRPFDAAGDVGRGSLSLRVGGGGASREGALVRCTRCPGPWLCCVTGGGGSRSGGGGVRTRYCRVQPRGPRGRSLGCGRRHRPDMRSLAQRVRFGGGLRRRAPEVPDHEFGGARGPCHPPFPSPSPVVEAPVRAPGGSERGIGTGAEG